MFDTILNLFVVALFVYFLADAVIYFARASGSLKQRLLTSGHSSPIIISSRFVSSVGAGINSAVWLADAAHAPQVSQAITTYLPPRLVATILIAIVLKILRGGSSAQQHKRLMTMPPLFLIMIGCAIVGLDLASAHTHICSEEIARVEALVDQPMGNPIAKPTAAQSVDAQLHHQPTPRSVRRANENAKSMFAAILARAKALNRDGKTDECIQSIAEARRLLSIE
jgi:hypothetical protein